MDVSSLSYVLSFMKINKAIKSNNLYLHDSIQKR